MRSKPSANMLLGQPYKPFSATPKGLAVVQSDPRLLEEELIGATWNARPPAIQPSQVGAFRFTHPDARQLLLHRLVQEIPIRLQVLQHLV
mgnify:CR=1 FL=1